ncbi:phosphatase PAP2 family protein, partial [Arthrospira platensis SPKY1]|nr:phosphatase PAP2 family protein [Arthrospira platensis SPKY1]
THASVIFSIGWLGVALRINWRLLMIWWSLGLIIVTGRVVCALHYPSDIIGGLFVGLFSAAVAFWLVNQLSPYKNLIAKKD